MTLEEIKDQVSIEYGWKSWKSCYGDDGITNTMIGEVAERYAQSQTQYLIKSLDAKQGQIDKLIKKYDRREIDFKSQTQELQQQNAELVELVERCRAVIYAYNDYRPTATGNEILQAIQDRLTKYNHLKSNTNGNTIE